MYVVYSIKDQIHCTIMNYMYYLPHLFYSIFEVILFFTQHLIGQRHDQTWCNDQTRTEKIVFLEKEKGNFVNCWREKFTTNAKNDKNEIKTQVIYLYHTRYMAIRLLVAHKNKTLEVSQIWNPILGCFSLG